MLEMSLSFTHPPHFPTRWSQWQKRWMETGETKPHEREFTPGKEKEKER